MRSFNMAGMPRNPYLGGSPSSPFGGGGGISMIGNGGMGTIGDTSHLRATNHWRGRDAQKARDAKARGMPAAPQPPQGPPAPPAPPGPANNPFSGGRPDPDGWTEDDFNKADQRGWTPEQDPNSVEARYEFERREREANGGKTRYQRDQAAGGGPPPMAGKMRQGDQRSDNPNDIYATRAGGLPMVGSTQRSGGNPYLNAGTSAGGPGRALGKMRRGDQRSDAPQSEQLAGIDRSGGFGRPPGVGGNPTTGFMRRSW